MESNTPLSLSFSKLPSAIGVTDKMAGLSEWPQMYIGLSLIAWILMRSETIPSAVLFHLMSFENNANPGKNFPAWVLSSSEVGIARIYWSRLNNYADEGRIGNWSVKAWSEYQPLSSLLLTEISSWQLQLCFGIWDLCSSLKLNKDWASSHPIANISDLPPSSVFCRSFQSVHESFGLTIWLWMEQQPANMLDPLIVPEFLELLHCKQRSVL